MTYSLEPHLCRYCLGNILSAPKGDKIEYICSCCRRVELSDNVNILCMCGFRIKGKLIYKCAENKSVTAVKPSKYVAVER